MEMIRRFHAFETPSVQLAIVIGGGVFMVEMHGRLIHCDESIRAPAETKNTRAAPEEGPPRAVYEEGHHRRDRSHDPSAVEGDHESSRVRAATPIHGEVRAISGVHPRLHAGKRPASGACRRTAVFPPHPADGSPDAADTREGGIDLATTGHAAIPRCPRRARPAAAPRSAGFQPVKFTVTRY